MVNSAEILHYGSGVQHHNMNVWSLAGSDIGDVMGGGVLLGAGWPVDYDQVSSYTASIFFNEIS